MADLERLREAIRDELTIQHSIDRRVEDSDWLDLLADMVTSRIDYGFEVNWNPHWVKPGAPHRWDADGEFYIECLQCRRVAVHPRDEEATAWYEAHISVEHDRAMG